MLSLLLQQFKCLNKAIDPHSYIAYYKITILLIKKSHMMKYISLTSVEENMNYDKSYLRKSYKTMMKENE